ncbi:MAG TPA: hypothetical protein VG898_05660 [Solirubrobacterales bacterium]|nr:hypothetical protein [Solirubrobacterales bacterium]
MAAARLTDVGAGNSHPLVLGGGDQHPLEQLAVARLQFVLPAQGASGLGDAVGEGVADALQVLQARYPRRTRPGGHLSIDGDAGEGLGGEPRELVLEAANLPPQLGAGEALVTPHSQRRERVSVEQFHHRTASSVDHRAKAENEEPVKTSEGRGEHQPQLG